MGVKEAAIVGGILGGAGGAGGAYAADLGGIRTGGRTSEKRFDFTSLGCVDELLKGTKTDGLNKSNVGDVQLTGNNSPFNAKKGCFKVKLLREGDDAKSRLNGLNFEWVVSDEDNGTWNKGIIAWSSITKSAENNENNAKLVSRVFYVFKGEGASKGLEFTSVLDLSKAKWTGLDKSDLMLKTIFDGASGNDSTLDENKINKTHLWTHDTTKTNSIFNKVTIKQDDIAKDGFLLFGRDLITDDISKVTAIYAKNKGWKDGKEGVTVQSLLEATTSVQGQWKDKQE